MRRMLDLTAAYTLMQAIGALGIFDRVLYGAWDGKGGDKFTQLTGILSILAALFLIYASRGLRRMPKEHYLPFLITALLLVSAAWSMDMGGTIRRAVNYLALVACALGMAHSIAPARIMKIIVVVCAISAMASVCLRMTPYGVLFDPGSGATDFIGIFGVKNTLGEAMAAGVFGALYCLMAEPRGKTKYVLLLLLFLGVIIAAKCATALLVSLSYILVLSLLTLHARGGSARTISHCMLVGGLLLGGLVFAMPDIFFQLLGKDPTLTGRTDIWSMVWTPIFTKPILGWGFNGFWIFSNPAAMEISGALGWFVPEAHNGLLECLLQLGVFGTGLILLQIIHCLLLGWRCIRYGDVHLGRITVAFIVGLLIMSISEAILLTPGMVATLQFFLCGFMCEVSLVAARRRKDQLNRDTAKISLMRDRSCAAI